MEENDRQDTSSTVLDFGDETFLLVVEGDAQFGTPWIQRGDMPDVSPIEVTCAVVRDEKLILEDDYIDPHNISIISHGEYHSEMFPASKDRGKFSSVKINARVLMKDGTTYDIVSTTEDFHGLGFRPLSWWDGRESGEFVTGAPDDPCIYGENEWKIEFANYLQAKQFAENSGR